MPKIIDGKELSKKIRTEITQSVSRIKEENKRVPHLAIILIGDDGASHTYVNGKIKACKEVGFEFTLMQFAATITEEKLIKHIDRFNSDSDIDGFIVQLPLPNHISVEKITERFSPFKDVDGFTNQNFGSIISKNQLLLPATSFAVMEIIRRYNIPTKKKHCVIIGTSRIVGAPLSLMLLQKEEATVTICHKNTENLKFYTQQADILIVAVGKSNMITEDMIKEGAVIIDVGINRIKDSTKKYGFKLVGDVDYERVSRKASYITPVPGGVGPMTIASLLLNTLKAYKNHAK